MLIYFRNNLVFVSDFFPSVPVYINKMKIISILFYCMNQSQYEIITNFLKPGHPLHYTCDVILSYFNQSYVKLKWNISVMLFRFYLCYVTPCYVKILPHNLRLKIFNSELNDTSKFEGGEEGYISCKSDSCKRVIKWC